VRAHARPTATCVAAHSLHPCARSSTLGNTVELSTGDLRSGKAFDSIKATWGQALRIGQFKDSKLSAEYDYSANKDFLKEASLTGDLAEGDISVSYDLTHDFASQKTTTKVTAGTTVQDVKVRAQVVDMSLDEVSAEKDVDLGDQAVNVQPSWLVQAKTARVKLMSKLQGGDQLSAQVDYNPDGGDTSYEVSYDHSIEAGRDISATLGADSLDVDYVDSKAEAGATWTASASVPTGGGASSLLDSSKLSLKRAWKW